MELSSIIIWIKVLGVLGGLFIGLAIAAWLCFVVAGIYFIAVIVDYPNMFEDYFSYRGASEKLKKKIIKESEAISIMESNYGEYKTLNLIIKSLIITFICGVLFSTMSSLVPEKSEIFIYATLKSVDEYNKKHEKSMLKPEEVLSIFDLSLLKLKNLIIEESELSNVSLKIDEIVNVSKDFKGKIISNK